MTTEQKPLDALRSESAIRKAAVTLKKLSDKAYLVDVIDTRERDENERISSDLVGHADALSALTAENATLRQQRDRLLEASKASKQCITDFIEIYKRGASNIVMDEAVKSLRDDALKLVRAAIKQVEESNV